MDTLATALDAAAQRLVLRSDSPRLDAELLLAHVLGRPRSHFRAHPEAPLPEPIAYRFETLLQGRERGEPIAYLTGKREFWSMELAVTPATLIPRPETELLVERALAQLPRNASLDLLDLGTGSGAVALALARERPKSRLIATDASAAALAVAAENARRLGIHNIHFIQADWFDFEPAGRFHLIVANPPYVALDDAHLAQGDLRFEPRAALVAAEDGFADLRRIVAGAPARLHAGGFLWLEHGESQGAFVRVLLEQHNFREVQTRRDLAGHERVSGGVFG